MTEVISVKFKSGGKVYYFDPAGNSVSAGDRIIVDTANGTELVECVEGNHEVESDKVVQPLRPMLRCATEADERYMQDNPRREAEAFRICEKKIADFGLDMKLVRVEYNFDGSKIIFFFTSDGRVDFRELVKELASVFKTRIILRQIGVRDEAKMIGGLGICGKPFCCATFLDDFQPVSIKMAKTQSLSLNPTKISGACGRLMCCLKYEQDAYEDAVKRAPKTGSEVSVGDVQGTVSEVNLLRETVKVRVAGQNEDKLMSFKEGELRLVEEKKESDTADLLLNYFSRFESAEKQQTRENGTKENGNGGKESRRRKSNHGKAAAEENGEQKTEQGAEQHGQKKSRGHHRRGSGKNTAAAAENGTTVKTAAPENAKNGQKKTGGSKNQSQSKNSAQSKIGVKAESAEKPAAEGSVTAKKKKHRYYRPRKNSGGSNGQ